MESARSPLFLFFLNPFGQANGNTLSPAATLASSVTSYITPKRWIPSGHLIARSSPCRLSSCRPSGCPWEKYGVHAGPRWVNFGIYNPKETSPGGSFKQGVIGGCVVVILRLYPQPSSHLTSSYLKARAAPPPILDHIPQTFTRLSELVMLLRWIKAPPPRGEPSCLGRKISQFNHNTRAGISVRVAPRGCWQVDAGEEPRRGGAELQPLQANASWLPWGGGSSPPLERGSWTPPSLPSLPEPAHPTSSPEQQPRILQLLHPDLGGRAASRTSHGPTDASQHVHVHGRPAVPAE